MIRNNENTINAENHVSKETLHSIIEFVIDVCLVCVVVMCYISVLSMIFVVITMGVAIALDIPFERAIVLVLLVQMMRTMLYATQLQNHLQVCELPLERIA